MVFPVNNFCFMCPHWGWWNPLALGRSENRPNVSNKHEPDLEGSRLSFILAKVGIQGVFRFFFKIPASLPTAGRRRNDTEART